MPFQTLKTSEAAMAADFILRYAENNFSAGLSFCTQHADTIMIYTGDDNNWLGLLVSYRSPALYNTAVIEGITVQANYRRQGIASALLSYAANFWKTQCIYNIYYITNIINTATSAFAAKQGFKTAAGNGLIRIHYGYCQIKCACTTGISAQA